VAKSIFAGTVFSMVKTDFSILQQKLANPGPLRSKPNRIKTIIIGLAYMD
jgi:hypothetical protein